MTTSVNAADPVARLSVVQLTVPVPPTAGVVQIQPPAGEFGQGNSDTQIEVHDDDDDATTFIARPERLLGVVLEL